MNTDKDKAAEILKVWNRHAKAYEGVDVLSRSAFLKAAADLLEFAATGQEPSPVMKQQNLAQSFLSAIKHWEGKEFKDGFEGHKVVNMEPIKIAVQLCRLLLDEQPTPVSEGQQEGDRRLQPFSDDNNLFVKLFNRIMDGEKLTEEENTFVTEFAKLYAARIK